MGRHYGFPVLSCGLSSDAKELCVQVGSDGGPMAFCTILAGADLLTGAGMLDSAQLLYLPKLVLDAELVRQGQRLTAGLALDDEHVMLDVTRRVGPGGHFLAARETRRFLRNGELQLPHVFVRGSYDGWLADGRSESQRATEKVDEILATHHPLPLPDGAAQRIEEIIAAAGEEKTAE
jgi:trimethylamine--corrinoid protein Co-methyltransferase